MDWSKLVVDTVSLICKLIVETILCKGKLFKDKISLKVAILAPAAGFPSTPKSTVVLKSPLFKVTKRVTSEVQFIFRSTKTFKEGIRIGTKSPVNRCFQNAEICILFKGMFAEVKLIYLYSPLGT